MKKPIIFLILFASLALTANAKAKGNKLSFESEEGSLSITNYTNQDVVVLVGRVERNLVIGGIRSGDRRTFNLSKLPNIPKKCTLLVRIAPYEVYRKKGRIDREDVVYTRLVVHDSTSRKSEVFFNIPKQIDMEQKHCVYLTNSSIYVLEVREGSPTGEVLATLSPMLSNKPIFLLPKRDYGAYDLFPLFLYRDIKTGEVVSTVPSRADRMRIMPKPIATMDAAMVRFCAPQGDVISYNVAFIHLKNDTSSAIEFRNAKKFLKSQKGWYLTESGQINVYELDVNSNEGEVYSTLEFEFDNAMKLPLNSYKFKRGYEYKITVSRINGKFQYKIEEIGKKKSFIEDAKIELFMED